MLVFKMGGERSQGLVQSAAIADDWIGAKRRSLTSEGRQPLSLPAIRLSEVSALNNEFWDGFMAPNIAARTFKSLKFMVMKM